MIGGDIRLAEVKLRRKAALENHDMFPTARRANPIGYLGALVLMIKSSTGTDPFLVSGAFFDGWIVPVIACILVTIALQFSFILFTKTWVYGEAYRFIQIWEYTFGPKLMWIPALLVMLAYLSFVMFGGWEMYHYMRDLLVELWPLCPSVLLNKWLLLYGVSAVFVFPVLFGRRLSSLTLIGWISLFSSLTAFVCLVLFLRHKISTIGFNSQKEIKFFTSEPKAILRSISKLSSLVFFHPTAAIILRDMERPTAKRCASLTWISSVYSGLFGLICGLTSHFIFRQSNNALIFDFLDYHRPEVVIGIIASYVISVTSTGFYVWFIADNIATFVLRESEGKIVPRIASGLVVVLAYVMVNFIDHMVVDIVSLIGAVMVVSMAYILSPAFYLAQFQFHRAGLGIGAFVLLLFGVFVLVLRFYFHIEMLLK
jgi:hypothetical protein